MRITILWLANAFLCVISVGPLESKKIDAADVVGVAALGTLALGGAVYAVAEVMLHRLRRSDLSIKDVANTLVPSEVSDFDLTARATITPEVARKRAYLLRIQHWCQRVMIGSTCIGGGVIAKQWWDQREKKRSKAAPKSIPFSVWDKAFISLPSNQSGMDPDEVKEYAEMDPSNRLKKVLEYVHQKELGKVVDALTYDEYPTVREIGRDRLAKSLVFLQVDSSSQGGMIRKYEAKFGRVPSKKEIDCAQHFPELLARAKDARNETSVVNETFGTEKKLREATYHVIYGDRKEES